MYSLIPLAIIFVCLIVILRIVIKKFPDLAMLDTGTIKEEQENKFKEKIIGDRLKRNFFEKWKKTAGFLKPVGNFIVSALKILSENLHNLREKYKQNKPQIIEDIKQRVEVLFVEMEEARRAGELSDAEKKLIEIISLENKNIKAFKSLGQIYLEQKNHKEAKQTFLYLLKLLEAEELSYNKLINSLDKSSHQDIIEETNSKQLDIACEKGLTFSCLSEIEERAGNFDQALVYIEKSLNLEPNSPRYLDAKLNLAIDMKDRVKALESFEKLAKVNPENQKLEEIKQKIDEL